MKRAISFFLFSLCVFAVPLQATVVDVLCRLKVRAEQTKTDALLIVRQGKPVFEHCRSCDFPRLDCREMSRPILALAIGFLSDERYITSLDTPVSTFCPSWATGPDAAVSIRGLLADEGENFYRLGEVVKAITGQEWLDYIQIKLLTPLGIRRDCWNVDNSGRVRLTLSAPELAKIGLLIARNGDHCCKQLISRHWISLLQTPTGHIDPFLAMQWFLEYYDFSTYWDEGLVRRYACEGVSGRVVALLSALNGRVVHFGGLAVRGQLIHGWGRDIFCSLGGQEGLTALVRDAYCRQLPLGYFNGGGVKSIVAWGSGGQQLIIVPGRNIVAVRQTTRCQGDDFEDFIELIDDYLREVDCYID